MPKKKKRKNHGYHHRKQSKRSSSHYLRKKSVKQKIYRDNEYLKRKQNKQKIKEQRKDETIESLNQKLMQNEEISKDQLLYKNQEIEALKNENYQLKLKLKRDTDRDNDPEYVPSNDSKYSDDTKMDYVHMSSFTSPRNCNKIVSSRLLKQRLHKSGCPSASSIQRWRKAYSQALSHMQIAKDMSTGRIALSITEFEYPRRYD
eukprot:427877_1